MRGPTKQTRVVMVMTMKQVSGGYFGFDELIEKRFVFSKIVAKKAGKWSDLFKMVEAFKKNEDVFKARGSTEAYASNTIQVKGSEDGEWVDFASGAGWSSNGLSTGSRRVFLQVKKHHMQECGFDHIDEVPDLVMCLV